MKIFIQFNSINQSKNGNEDGYGNGYGNELIFESIEIKVFFFFGGRGEGWEKSVICHVWTIQEDYDAAVYVGSGEARRGGGRERERVRVS